MRKDFKKTETSYFTHNNHIRADLATSVYFLWTENPQIRAQEEVTTCQSRGYGNQGVFTQGHNLSKTTQKRGSYTVFV